MQNLTSLTQTSAGNITVKSGNTISLGGTIKPTTSDGAALGTSSLMFSDLFLASGGVINFNNGDVTITHSSNKLAIAGGTSYTFDAVLTPASNDGAALGTTSLMFSDLFLATGAVINFNNGDVTVTHSSNKLALAGGTSYTIDAALTPATNDAAALGTGALSFADLFLATGGVINWLNGSTTLTHSPALLTLGGSASAQCLALGVDGTGWSLVAYGDTAGCSFTWDQTNDQLQVVQTNAATTGVERAVTISQTMTGIGASAEAAAATLTSNVVCGTYANAFCGKINLSTAGGVTGLAGVICAELDMPGGACAAGTYSVYEAEINMPASYSGAVPINVFQINVWGDTAASFDDYGNLFEITGVTSGAAHIWYDHQATAPTNVEEWIRVKTPAGARYLALYNAVA